MKYDFFHRGENSVTLAPLARIPMYRFCKGNRFIVSIGRWFRNRKNWRYDSSILEKNLISLIPNFLLHICPRIFENFWGIRRVVRLFFFLFFGKKITEAGNFTFDKIFLLRPVTTLPVTFLYLIDTRTSLLIIILIPSSNWQNYEFWNYSGSY